MKTAIIILLSAAVVMLVLSAVETVKTLKFFFGSEEKDSESSKSRLVSFRNRLVICYAASVILIVTAAILKAFS